MQKASQWTRAIVLALVLFSTSASAQESAPAGVLLTAPEFRHGIDWLPANVIPHWFATYRTIIDEAVLQIDVLYIEGPVEGAREWLVAPCRVRRLLSSGEGQYYYESPRDWSLLVTAASGAEAHRMDPPSPIPAPCEFVDLFVSRFQFFQNMRSSSPRPEVPLGSPGRAPDFPAILSPAQ